MTKKDEQQYPKWSGLKANTAEGISVNEVVDPAEFQKIKDRIEKKHGHIPVREIWKAVENKPNAKIHPMFEWDNEVAGDKFRDEQARMGIRCLVSPVMKDDGTKMEMRQVVSVKLPSDEKPVYRSLNNVAQSIDQMEYLQQQTLNSLVAWRRRWRQYSYVADWQSQLDIIDGVIHVMKDLLAAGEKD